MWNFLFGQKVTRTITTRVITGKTAIKPRVVLKKRETELSGNCKIAFENWYTAELNYTRGALDYFYIRLAAEKYGIYIDFFTSVGFRTWWYYDFDDIKYDVRGRGNPCRSGSGEADSIEEAREKVIEIANTIYNETTH
jgi:hypothetical protein